MATLDRKVYTIEVEQTAKGWTAYCPIAGCRRRIELNNKARAAAAIGGHMVGLHNSALGISHKVKDIIK